VSSSDRTFVAEARALERALRKAVLAEIAGDPEQKAEHKRLSKSRGGAYEVPGLLLLLLLGCGALAVVPRPLLALLLVWHVLATLGMFGHANELLDRLAAGRLRMAALPFSHAALFDLERRRAARHRWWWLGVFCVLALAGVGTDTWASAHGFQWQRAVTWAGIAVIQALSLHSFALILTRVLPDAPAKVLGCSCCLILVAVVVLGIAFGGEMAVGILDLIAAHPWLLLLTPLGWAPHALLALVDQRWVETLWILPTLIAIAYAPRAATALSTWPWAALPEEEQQDLGDLGPAEDDEAQEGVLSEIRGASWFSDWAAHERGGWLDRAILTTLSQRERLVYRFLQPDPGWTLRWYLGVAGLLLALVLGLVFGDRVGGFFVMIAVLTGMAAMPVPGHDGLPGLSLARLSGGWIPRYAFYPLTYAGLSRVLLKVNFLRAAAFLPAMVALVGPIAATQSGWDLYEGWVLGGRLTLITLGLVPAIAATQVDSTLEGFSFRLRWIPVLIAWVILVTLGSILVFVQPTSSIRVGMAGLEFDAGSIYGALGTALVWACGWSVWFLGPRWHTRRDLLRTKAPDGYVEGE
jgi:hypothetical protein